MRRSLEDAATLPTPTEPPSAPESDHPKLTFAIAGWFGCTAVPSLVSHPIHSRRSNSMGLFDKAKDAVSKGKDSVNVDSLKETAGKAKDSADRLVEQHSDKIPDSAEKVYKKASDAAEKVIPGEDATGE
jgi:hypothetical protein